MQAISLAEKEELAKFISEKGVKILNSCHVPEDGRLKTLSFSASDKGRVSEILEFGERVDGSNLFSFIESEKSDIYIKPNIKKAFMNPFSNTPTLNVLCDYLDENGKPLDAAPKTYLKDRKLRGKWCIPQKLMEKTIEKLRAYRDKDL